mgnify:CR=1 FL=1
MNVAEAPEGVLDAGPVGDGHQLRGFRVTPRRGILECDDGHPPEVADGHHDPGRAVEDSLRNLDAAQLGGVLHAVVMLAGAGELLVNGLGKEFEAPVLGAATEVRGHLRMPRIRVVEAAEKPHGFRGGQQSGPSARRYIDTRVPAVPAALDDLAEGATELLASASKEESHTGEPFS